MNYEDITKIHPTLFLEQLGKHTGKIVGLGEPVVEGVNTRTATFPVLLSGEEIGKYMVTANTGTGYVKIMYEGRHPLAYEGKKNVNFTYKRDHPLGDFVRTDGWKKIVFPSQIHRRHKDSYNYMGK